MSTWFPAFQRRHTFFVIGLLAIALAASPFIPSLPLPWQLAILAVAVVVFGLPHGALDLALVQGAARGSWGALAAAIGVYLVVSIAVLAVWITAPVVALFGFLAIAVIHFGLGDTEELRGPQRAVEVIARGGFAGIAPLVFHPQTTRDLFGLLVGAAATANLDLALAVMTTPATWLWIASLIIAVVWRTLQRAAGWLPAVAELLLTTAIFAVFHPLAAFLLYFCFVHSVRHIADLGASRFPHSAAHARRWLLLESFPMEWTYAYAVPNGLSYRLNKEPLATLPPDVVAEDFRYWNDYVERLLSDKNFHEDFDAKRSFSKLRNSTGNLYRARQMWSEAERAYRQALQLHPNNMESLVALSDILRAQKRWDEMAEIWERAIEGDPNNRAVRKARERVTRLREADREITALQRELAANPQNPEVVSNLLRLYMETGQADLARQQLEQSAQAFGDNPDFLKFAVDFSNSNGQWQAGLGPARKLANVMSNDAGVWLALARFEFANREMNSFLESARRAVQLGGIQAKSALANDPMYAMVRGTPEFQQLLSQ